MTDAPTETAWPRELWAAERHENENGPGMYFEEAPATVPRFEGDDVRDREWHRYVDEDILTSTERYHKAKAEELRAEIERLSEILTGIEILTATGEGLDAEQTICIHLIAAEGRADDPHAWRADPAVIERLRAALKPVETAA